MTLEKLTLANVKARQPNWFSRENKRFFNDRSYFVRYGKTTGNRYLCRSTYAWTDMFGQEPRLHYRINKLEEDLKIGSMLDAEFQHRDSLNEWLKEN